MSLAGKDFDKIARAAIEAALSDDSMPGAANIGKIQEPVVQDRTAQTVPVLAATHE